MLLIIYLILILVLLITNRKRIIHQTAPADKSKWKDVWTKCQGTWKDKFPSWEYRMWTDEDIDSFMKNEFPDFYKDYFVKYEKNIHRIDAFRYFVLYTYGGMYVDMDYECKDNFEFDIPRDKVCLNESTHEWDKGYQNALMVSPKGHKFWEHVFEKLKIKFDQGHKDVIQLTGPIILSETANEHPEMIFKLSKELFTENGAKYSTHHETASWQ